jgi:hypothetical protein
MEEGFKRRKRGRMNGINNKKKELNKYGRKQNKGRNK